MIKEISASAWILAAMATLFLGLNGNIGAAAMVIFGLATLAILYCFALWTVIVNTRSVQKNDR